MKTQLRKKCSLNFQRLLVVLALIIGFSMNHVQAQFTTGTKGGNGGTLGSFDLINMVTLQAGTTCGSSYQAPTTVIAPGGAADCYPQRINFTAKNSTVAAGLNLSSSTDGMFRYGLIPGGSAGGSYYNSKAVSTATAPINNSRFVSVQAARDSVILRNQYVGFTVRPASGKTLSMSTIRIANNDNATTSNTNPAIDVYWTLRCSLDNYASDIQTWTSINVTASTTIDLTNKTLNGITDAFRNQRKDSAISFRIYMYGNNSNGTAERIQADTLGNTTKGVDIDGSVLDIPNPIITSFSPSSLIAGAATQVLTINGYNFANTGAGTTTVTFNGVAHTATWISEKQLQITLDATNDLTVGGSYPVVVTNGSNTTTATLNFSVVPVPAITIADNGSQPNSSATFQQGVSGFTLQSFSIKDSIAATLDSVTFHLTGNYTAADIASFRLFYGSSSNPTLAGSQLGANYTPLATGSGETITFYNTAHTSLGHVIANGATEYYFLKAYIAQNATIGNTVTPGALTTADIKFASANKSGSVSAAGTQQIYQGATTAMDDIATQPSGNVAQYSSNVMLAGFYLNPTAGYTANWTGVNVYNAGTATSADIANVRIYRDVNNNGTFESNIDSLITPTGYNFPANTTTPIAFTFADTVSVYTQYLIVADVKDVAVSTVGRTVTLGIHQDDYATSLLESGSMNGAGTFTIVAPVGTSTVTAGTPPTTISSLATTSGTAVAAYSFTVKDDGNTPGIDGAATTISSIVINALGTTIPDWSAVLAGASLTDGTNTLTATSITTTAITFSSIPTTSGTLGYIADNASKTYTLNIWLKSALGVLQSTINGKAFVFRVQNASFTTTGGSGLTSGIDFNSGTTNNVITVTATKLAFATAPRTPWASNAVMPAFTVQAVDANGNYATTYANSNVSISASPNGIKGSSTVSATTVNGLATFSAVTFSTVTSSTNYTITAALTGLTSITSGTIVITTPTTNLVTFDFTGTSQDWVSNTTNSALATYRLNARTSDVAGATLDSLLRSPSSITAAEAHGGDINNVVGVGAGINGGIGYAIGNFNYIKYTVNEGSNVEYANNYLQTSVVLPAGLTFNSAQSYNVKLSSWGSSAANKKYYRTYYQYSKGTPPVSAITTTNSTSGPTTSGTGNTKVTINGATNANNTATYVTADEVDEVGLGTSNSYTYSQATIPPPPDNTYTTLTVQVRAWSSNTAGNWRLNSLSVIAPVAIENALLLTTPTVTVPASQSFTYNGLPQGPTNATVSPNSGGAVTYSYSGVSHLYGPSSTAPKDSGIYSVTASVAGTSTYNAATSSATTFTIIPATLTITGISVANKTYDGTAFATISGTAAYSGLQHGETFTVTGTPVASLLTKHVGAGKAVTITGYTAPSTNYIVTQPTVSNINVLQYPITVTAVTNAKAYDGNTSAAAIPVITVGTLQGTDVANFTESYTNATAGENKSITVSGSVTDGNNGVDYQVTKVSVSTGLIYLPTTWVGNINSDWNNRNNWSTFSVPDYGSDVTIPVISSQNSYPTLTASSTIHDLYIANGASVSIGANTLTINGVSSGTGTLIGSASSNLTLTNKTKTTLYFGTDNATDNLINTFTMNGTDTVILGNDLGITGLLTFNTPTNLNVNGNHLTLKSTSYTNTASLDQVPAGASITGSVTVERYIPRGLWEYEDLGTSGVANAGSIYRNWQENGVLGNGYGIYITGSIPGVPSGIVTNPYSLHLFNGMDIAYKNAPSMYTYTRNNWWDVKNTRDSSLNPFKGYRTFVRGNRNYNLYSNVGALTPTYMMSDATIRTTGELVSGDVKFSTSRIVSTTLQGDSAIYPGLQSGTNNWNLITNPYACPISWTSVLNHNTSSNIANTYYYVAKTYGGYNTYVSVKSLAGSIIVSPAYAAGNDYIQAGQGIWVYNTATSPSLTISEGDKSIVSNHTNVFGKATLNQLAINLSKKFEGNDVMIDGALAAFDNNFDKGISSEDSRKLTNPAENIAIEVANTNLSIAGLPVPTVSDVIALTLSALNQNEVYTLKADANNFNVSGLDAYIRDNETKSEILANTGLTFTANAATYNNRFSLVFKPATSPTTVITSTEAKATVSVYPNPVTEKIFTLQMSNIAKGKYNVTVIDNLGKELMTTVLNHETTTNNETIRMSNSLPTGMYRVVVKNTVSGVVYENSIITK